MVVETRAHRRKSAGPSTNGGLLHVDHPAGTTPAELIAHYDSIIAQERASHERNVFTRTWNAIAVFYYHAIYSLGIYMLEPWEMTIFWITVVASTVLVASTLFHIFQLAESRLESAHILGHLGKVWAALTAQASIR